MFGRLKPTCVRYQNMTDAANIIFEFFKSGMKAYTGLWKYRNKWTKSTEETDPNFSKSAQDIRSIISNFGGEIIILYIHGILLVSSAFPHFLHAVPTP